MDWGVNQGTGTIKVRGMSKAVRLRKVVIERNDQKNL